MSLIVHISIAHIFPQLIPLEVFQLYPSRNLSHNSSPVQHRAVQLTEERFSFAFKDCNILKASDEEAGLAREIVKVVGSFSANRSHKHSAYFPTAHTP